MDLAQSLALALTGRSEDPTEAPPRDPLVNMPPEVADIYKKMLFALAALWFVGVSMTFSFACKKWNACTGQERRHLSLRASLVGVSNIPVPMRFYRNQGDRWVNVCSFGLTVSALANLTATLLFGETSLGGAQGLFYFYSYFIIFILFALIYWPLFISRNQVHRLNGRIYGLLYSALMLVTVIISSAFNDQPRAYTLVLNLPYMVCSSVIFGYFCYTFYKFRERPTPSPVAVAAGKAEEGRVSDAAKADDFAAEVAEEDGFFYVRNIDGRTVRLNSDYFDIEEHYVSNLLIGPRLVQNRARALLAQKQNDEAKKTNWFVLKWRAFLLWLNTPASVRLSTRLLVGVVMALEVAYVLSVVFCFWFAEAAMKIVVPDPEDEDVIYALYMGTSIASAVFCFLVHTGFTTYNFRDHLKRLRRGDYGMVPGGREHKFDINDTIGFVGFSIGYALVGYVVMFIVIELVMIFAWAIIYIEDVRHYFWNRLVKEMLFIPVLSVVVFVQVQRIISRRVFLPDKVSRFWTTQSVLFTHYEYFMVFINAMRGVITYLYSRLLIPFGFMVLFSTRLDKSTMVQGMEWMDEGYCNYVGMLLADHHSNNPVLVLFIQFLTISLENRLAKGDAIVNAPPLPPSAPGRRTPEARATQAAMINVDEDDVDDPDADADENKSLLSGGKSVPAGHGGSSLSVTSPLIQQSKSIEIPAVKRLSDPRRAATRWHLAITLINNPSIKPLRKHAILSAREEEAQLERELAAAREALLLRGGRGSIPNF